MPVSSVVSIGISDQDEEACSEHQQDEGDAMLGSATFDDGVASHVKTRKSRRPVFKVGYFVPVMCVCLTAAAIGIALSRVGRRSKGRRSGKPILKPIARGQSPMTNPSRSAQHHERSREVKTEKNQGGTSQLMQWSVRMPPGHKMPNGVMEECLGPIRVPVGAGAAIKFAPLVNMSVVHHIVLFGTSTKRSPEAPNWYRSHPSGAVQPVGMSSGTSGNMCWHLEAPVLFSWARTGQSQPASFGLPSGFGFEVGRRAQDTQWLYLAVHYQNIRNEHHEDTSGLDITLTVDPPPSSVRVQWLHTERINIPPNAAHHMVCVQCEVQQGGPLVAFRNHAHRFARELWTDIIRMGTKVAEVGRTNGTAPQIYSALENGPFDMRVGDSLLLHCDYSSVGHLTRIHYGKDERIAEMCNQYLVIDRQVRLNCVFSGLVNDQCLAKEGLPYMPNKSWPLSRSSFGPCHGPACGLGQVSGIDVDAATGDVYVFHRSGRNFWNSQIIKTPTILQMSSAGELLGEFGRNMFMVPHGLTVHRSKNMLTLWLTDTGLHQIKQLDSKGHLKALLGKRGVPGKKDFGFNKPTDVAIGPNNAIFVADGYGNSRIAVFVYTSRGYEFQREFGSAGHGPHQFDTPHGITLDDIGRVYVADRNNGRIQVFGQHGELLDIWDSNIKPLQQSHPREPWRGYVCALSYNKQLGVVFALVGASIVMYDLNGNVVQSWGSAGTEDGQLSFPHALASYTNGRKSFVYVAELDTTRVQQFMAR